MIRVVIDNTMYSDKDMIGNTRYSDKGMTDNTRYSDKDMIDNTRYSDKDMIDNTRYCDKDMIDDTKYSDKGMMDSTTPPLPLGSFHSLETFYLYEAKVSFRDAHAPQRSTDSTMVRYVNPLKIEEDTSIQFLCKDVCKKKGILALIYQSVGNFSHILTRIISGEEKNFFIGESG